MQIYDVLKKDHRVVQDLLDQLVAVDKDNFEDRHELIQDIRDELIPHARAEETIFYNSLRALDAAKDIVMHGYQEHMEAEAILRLLQLKDTLDLEWKNSAKSLRKAIKHHIEEEEGKIFSAAKQIFTPQEATMMAKAFNELKPEVRTDGFLKNTFDIVTNLMPPRFAASLRTSGLDSILNQGPKH